MVLIRDERGNFFLLQGRAREKSLGLGKAGQGKSKKCAGGKFHQTENF